jgi:hypothetical protein
MQFRNCVLSAYLWRSVERVPSDFHVNGLIPNMLWNLDKARAMAKRWPWLYSQAELDALTLAGQGPQRPVPVREAVDLLC